MSTNMGWFKKRLSVVDGNVTAVMMLVAETQRPGCKCQTVYVESAAISNMLGMWLVLREVCKGQLCTD